MTAPTDITLQYFQRSARAVGPTSSVDQNAMMNEIAHDLSSIADLINNTLIPLLATVPAGTPDINTDAFTNGLDGETLYVDSRATASVNPDYHNSTSNRPKTIYESLAGLATTIEDLRVNLQNQISNLTASASSVSITDAGGLFTSTNVEDALQELMLKVNSL